MDARAADLAWDGVGMQQSGLFSGWARHSTLNFTDTSGRAKTKSEVVLPSADWYWVTDWAVELGGDVDSDGWQVQRDTRTRGHHRCNAQHPPPFPLC